MVWTVYILRCADGSFYTGVTNDMAKRLVAHANGSGAKYTRGRGPLAVVFTETHATRSEAQKRETAIKKLSRLKKQQLIDLV